jgi:hypothetical protein
MTTQTVALVNKDELIEEVERRVISRLKKNGCTNREYYSMKEVANIFGISTQALLNWHNNGELCYSQINGRNYYSISDVDAFIENCKNERLKRYAKQTPREKRKFKGVRYADMINNFKN